MSGEKPLLQRTTFEDYAQEVDRMRLPDGRNIAIKAAGACPLPADHSTAFFLHGSPGCRLGPTPRNFVLQTLQTRLITFDRPGYGRSDRQARRSIAHTAQDVAAIADTLGIERFGVIGRSGGVAHALGCAALLGNRVSGVVGLVGMGPPDDGFDRFAGMEAKNVVHHRRALENCSALETEYQRLAREVKANPHSFLHDFLWPQLSAQDRHALYSLPIGKLYADVYYEALVPQNAAGWIDDTLAVNNDWGFALGDISQPVALWHGKQDVFSPYEHSLHMAKQIRAGGNKHVEVTVAPSQGHFDALEVIPHALAWLHEQFIS